jgi:hypothetical protein
MNHAIVVRGHYCSQGFIPSEPMPETEGPAELIVFPQPERASQPGGSTFDLFGKAERLRSAEDIDAQIQEEREAWNDE